jgi:hypothetical protein
MDRKPPGSGAAGPLLAEPHAGEQDRAGVSGHPEASGTAGSLSAPCDGGMAMRAFLLRNRDFVREVLAEGETDYAE